MICAECKEPTAHRSHRAGFVDWFWNLLHRKPYRCRKCGARFYSYRGEEQSPKLRTPEEIKIMEMRRSSKWKRSKRELLIYGAGSLVLMIVLYFLIQQRLGGNS